MVIKTIIEFNNSQQYPKFIKILLLKKTGAQQCVIYIFHWNK